MSEKDISDQFTEAEKALDQSINAYVFAPKFSPAVGGDISKSYELMKEDLQFQSSLGENLKQQQSIIYAHAQKRDLAEQAYYDQKDAEEAYAANKFVIKRMGQGLDFPEADREAMEKFAGLSGNKTWLGMHEHLKGNFETNEGRREREAKERLAPFTEANELFKARRTRDKNEITRRNMPLYYEDIEREVELGRWGQEKEVIEMNLGKVHADLNMSAFVASDGLAGMVRKSTGGGIGTSSRSRPQAAGGAGAVEVGDFRPIDDTLDTHEINRLTFKLAKDTGLVIDHLPSLLSHLDGDDSRAGFIESERNWHELENALGLDRGTVEQAILDLSDEDLNIAARKNPEGEAADKLRAASKLIRKGGGKYLIDYDVDIKKRNDEAKEKEELDAIRKQMGTATKDIYPMFADLAKSLFLKKASGTDEPDNYDWERDWSTITMVQKKGATKGVLEAKSVSPRTASSDEFDALYADMESSMDNAWNVGGDIISAMINKAEHGSNFTTKQIMDVYEKRLRYPANYALGRMAPNKFDNAGDLVVQDWEDYKANGPDYSRTTPHGYIKDIRGFIMELFEELKKPVKEQRDPIRIRPMRFSTKEGGHGFDPVGGIWKVSGQETLGLTVSFVDMLRKAEFTKEHLEKFEKGNKEEKKKLLHELRLSGGVGWEMIERPEDAPGGQMGYKQKVHIMKQLLANPKLYKDEAAKITAEGTSAANQWADENQRARAEQTPLPE